MSNFDWNKIKSYKLLYPELSFKLNGILIDVHKQLGGGHKEKVYQRAIAEALKEQKIEFVEQYYIPLKYSDKVVGSYYLDFLIDGKIILELKRGGFVPLKIIDQVKIYLKTINLKLGLLDCFTHPAVIIKRIINEY